MKNKTTKQGCAANCAGKSSNNGLKTPKFQRVKDSKGKLLFLTIGSGLFSLGCWGRMLNKPELRTLHLAIIGMLTSAIGLIFLFLVGSASPV